VAIVAAIGGRQAGRGERGFFPRDGLVGIQNRPEGRFCDYGAVRPGSVKDRLAVADDPDLNPVVTSLPVTVHRQRHPGASLRGACMTTPRNGDAVDDHEHVEAVFLDLHFRRDPCRRHPAG
jgi:hypothetical protein